MQERRLLQYLTQDDIPANAQEITSAGQSGNVIYYPRVCYDKGGSSGSTSSYQINFAKTDSTITDIDDVHFPYGAPSTNGSYRKIYCISTVTSEITGSNNYYLPFFDIDLSFDTSTSMRLNLAQIGAYRYTTAGRFPIYNETDDIYYSRIRFSSNVSIESINNPNDYHPAFYISREQ